MALFSREKIASLIRSVYRPGLARNSTMSAVQSLIGITCVLLSYRILTGKVGIEGLGLWSLLVAGSMIGRLADVGGGGGLARFVAAELAKTDDRDPAAYVHTVLLTTLALNCLTGSLLWGASSYLIHQFLEPDRIQEAWALLPYVLVNSIFLSPAAATLCSGLDGTQRADLRAILVSGGSIIFLVLTWLLTPTYGTVGFALAQALQQGVIIVGAWILISRRVPDLGFAPTRWQLSTFKATVSFGAKTQLITIAAVIGEPIVKLLFNAWGGLASVGQYELALRVLTQVRGLLVSAAQPLMAAIAASEGRNREVAKIMTRATAMSAWAGALISMGTVLVSPLYSLLVLHSIDQRLIEMIAVLAFGFGINSIGVPAHFAALGLGITKWNIAAQGAYLFCAVFVGSALGFYFGANGVLSGVVLGLISTALVTVAGNARAIGQFGIVSRSIPALTIFALGSALFTMLAIMVASTIPA